MNRKLIPILLSCLGAVAVPITAAPAFFAMDTGTRDAAHQTAQSQMALVKELGFDGIGPTYTSAAALREMLTEADRQQSKVFAVYESLKLDEPQPLSARIQDAIGQLRGRDAILWLTVMHKGIPPSDPAGDAVAVEVLQQIARLAGTAKVKVALYPHAGSWLERSEDAVRLAKAVNHKHLGVTFNLCHWLKVDGKDLEARLKEAMPYLMVVTVNGADAGARDWGKLIQPLDSGDFDIGQLLAILKNLDYQGPFGLQHFGIRGDVRANLQRSMAAWRKLQQAP
ncbi:MAG: sugar phosphate isomerase/epimerase family protein [Luteolibacter sp.]